jgi:histidinol-phosphatase (PHP family)
MQNRSVIRANYHTHTVRCHHAAGTEREYIEAAIKAGFRVLGFADHGTYLIDNYNFRIRMLPEETAEYISTLKRLRDEYIDDIEIHIGFELEYYPTYFERTLEYLKQFDYEYLILGQHYIDDGAEKMHVMNSDGSDAILTKYVDTVIAGINTGKFSYVAHPDVVKHTGDEDFYKAEMKRLCLAAKAAGIPLELNCVGVMKNRCYPNDKFWRIAGDVHNSVIIGVDAHSPGALQNRTVWQEAERRLAELNITPVTDWK